MLSTLAVYLLSEVESSESGGWLAKLATTLIWHSETSHRYKQVANIKLCVSDRSPSAEINN